MRSEEKALEALKLAVDLGGDINATKEDGRTALHAAAYLGWNSVVEFLVAKGANIEAKDIYGQTPLTVAMGDPEGLIYRRALRRSFPFRPRAEEDCGSAAQTGRQALYRQVPRPHRGIARRCFGSLVVISFQIN